MTLQVSQSVAASGTTPVPLTPALSDTIAEGSFGLNGLYARVITTSTATNVAVQDPGRTPQNNPGTITPAAVPSGAVRMVPIPRGAIDPATGLATITFSAITGVTYELYRV